MADFGTDISSYPDLDPIGTLVSGNVGLCQRVARRLTNQRGTWFWALNECTDLRSYLNDVLTSDRLSSIKTNVEREVLHEEVVLTANADVKVSPTSTLGQMITIHVTGQTRNGTFAFVLSVTAVTLTILKAG